MTNSLKEQIWTENAVFHKRKFAEVNVFCPATLMKLNEIQ